MCKHNVLKSKSQSRYSEGHIPLLNSEGHIPLLRASTRGRGGVRAEALLACTGEDILEIIHKTGKI